MEIEPSIILLTQFFKNSNMQFEISIFIICRILDDDTLIAPHRREKNSHLYSISTSTVSWMRSKYPFTLLLCSTWYAFNVSLKICIIYYSYHFILMISVNNYWYSFTWLFNKKYMINKNSRFHFQYFSKCQGVWGLNNF